MIIGGRKFSGLPFLTVVVFVLAGWLFFHNFDKPSVFTDEVIYAQTGLQYAVGDFHANLEHPFLGKMLIGVFAFLGGLSDFWVRLPGMLFGVGIILAVFIFIKKVTNKNWLALGSSLTLLFAPEFLWTSPRALLDNPLAFFSFLSLVSFWFFLKSVKEPEKFSKGWLGLCFVSFILAFSCKFTAILLAPVFLFSYLSLMPWKRKDLLQQVKFIIFWFAISVLIFLLIHYTIFPHYRAWIWSLWDHWGPQAPEMVVGHDAFLAGKTYGVLPWWTYLYYSLFGFESNPGYSLIFLIFAPVVIFTNLFLRGKSFFNDLTQNPFLQFLILGFLVFSLVLSFKQYRYLILLTPSLVVALALSLNAICERFRNGRFKNAEKVIAVIFGFVLLLQFWQIRPYFLGRRIDGYKLAASVIAKNLTSHHNLIFAFAYPDVLNWYLPQYPFPHGYYPTRDIDIPDYRKAAIIVVDKNMSQRYPADPILAYLKEHRLDFEEERVDNLTIFNRIVF